MFSLRLDCCTSIALQVFSIPLYCCNVALPCVQMPLEYCNIVVPLVVLGGHFTRDGTRDRCERTLTYV